MLFLVMVLMLFLLLLGWPSVGSAGRMASPCSRRPRGALRLPAPGLRPRVPARAGPRPRHDGDHPLDEPRPEPRSAIAVPLRSHGEGVGEAESCPCRGLQAPAGCCP